MIKKTIVTSLFIMMFLLLPKQAKAEKCFCYTDFGVEKPATECKSSVKDAGACKALETKEKYKGCEWIPDADCTARLQKQKEDNVKYGKSLSGKASVSKIIPDCALQDNLPMSANGEVLGECGDVSIFVTILLNASNYLFTIIGAVALAVFIYGGFMMILSQGNQEKVQKGKEAILAAVIGLIVAFGGYVLIKFVGEVVGVQDAFKLK